VATVTHAVTMADTSNLTAYTTGAFTPAASDLLVAGVGAANTIAAGTMTDSQGLGFTKITSGLFMGSADTYYFFVANALAAASSMTVTFDCTGDAASGVNFFVSRVAGMTATGSAAVRQTAKDENGTGSNNPCVSQFASACLTANPTLGYVFNGNNPAAQTPPTNWTEQADTGFATPSRGGEYISRDSGFTGTQIQWGSIGSATYGALIVELDTGAAPPPTEALLVMAPFVPAGRRL
jgi:hypothetical protein